MKDLIKKALDEANIALQERVPLTKKVVTTKSIEIMDITPFELPAFMEKNKIPRDAYFNGKDNGYDAYSDFLLCWDIVKETKTSNEEKLAFKRKAFSDMAFRRVYQSLIPIGFKRKSPYHDLVVEFKDITLYDIYSNGDFDTLERYFSLYFQK